MRIGIRYSDNDFYFTVTSFLKFLCEQDGHRGLQPANLTKERVVQLFNRMAPGFYWVKQNGFSYNLEWKPEEYLKIEEKHVFLGDEVQAYIDACDGWDNCEFFFGVLGKPEVEVI